MHWSLKASTPNQPEYMQSRELHTDIQPIPYAHEELKTVTPKMDTR